MESMIRCCLEIKMLQKKRPRNKFATVAVLKKYLTKDIFEYLRIMVKLINLSSTYKRSLKLSAYVKYILLKVNLK